MRIGRVAVATSFLAAATAMPASAADREPSGIFRGWVAYPTDSWPEAVAIGDVNGDGLNDVALVTSFYFSPENDFKLFTFLQRSDGSLAPAVKYPTLGTHPQPPTTVAVGDVNGDSLNDVVVGNLRGGVSVLLQDRRGRLRPPMLYPTADAGRVRLADLNDDGRLDVASMGPDTNTVSVLLQQPTGMLGSPVAYAAPHAGGDLETGDVNGDGLADVVVMSTSVFAIPDLSVLYQQSNGTLGGLVSHFIGPNINSNGVGIGDVSSDGRNDVVVAYGGNVPNSNIAVFHQLSDGTLDDWFSAPARDLPTPVEIGDVDGNGLSDVVVAHAGSAVGVYLQGSHGQLAGEKLYPLPFSSGYYPNALALGDINNDGATDVAVADYTLGLVVLRHMRWWVTLTDPNGPATWPVGTVQRIAWTSKLPAGSRVDLDVSRDGGLIWTPIATDVPDTGSYDWTVTGPSTDAARIRVAWTTMAKDRPARLDASDFDFRITSAGTGAVGPWGSGSEAAKRR